MTTAVQTKAICCSVASVNDVIIVVDVVIFIFVNGIVVIGNVVVIFIFVNGVVSISTVFDRMICFILGKVKRETSEHAITRFCYTHGFWCDLRAKGGRFK